jgi:hypothetical protein
VNFNRTHGRKTHDRGSDGAGDDLVLSTYDLAAIIFEEFNAPPTEPTEPKDKN